MRILAFRVPFLIAIFFLCVISLMVMSADERYIAFPILACTIMMVWLWLVLWARDKNIPFYDVGIFCAFSIFIYSIYPLINYWAGDFQFGLFSDARLQQYNITPEQLGILPERTSLSSGI